MPKQIVNLGAQGALLDVVSYGRRGPGCRNSITSAQRDQITRTVRRTPEVMIKVSGGGRSLKGVKAHVEYIVREGDLELETDEGERLKGDGVARGLIDNWDLDLVTHRRQSAVSATNGRELPRLVHNIIFSMPAGTPPDKLLAAVRKFTQEEFALRHRYAMVLHTDQKHPHVHVVVKATSEEGVRLNIRKATLREWRNEFARHLREHGVAANATERAVRGVTTNRKPDGIYRANLRGESSHWRERAEYVAKELLHGDIHVQPDKVRLLQVRHNVERGWWAVSRILEGEGHHGLALAVNRFVQQMSPPRTENEWIAAELHRKVQNQRGKEYGRNP